MFKASLKKMRLKSRKWGTRGSAAATFAKALSFDTISHAYNQTLSVKNISLTIKPGETVCLLGESGCGKTTLLRLACGIERPKSGRIFMDTQEVASPTMSIPPEKRGIGLVFQDYALFPHMTILKNVAFGLHGLSGTQRRQEALHALERVGLRQYANKYPHALSGGEQQRVALVRALAPRPGVLLMDEPFSGLDQRLRLDMRSETATILRETRATCILVTHDPEEAMQMGERIALMKKGRLHQVGTADTLYLRPRDIFAARFFSPLTEIQARVENGKISTPFGVIDTRTHPFIQSLPLNMPLGDGAKVLVCFRPNHLRLSLPTGSGIPGRILTRCFLGALDQFEVGIQTLETLLLIRQCPTEHGFFSQDVHVHAALEEALIFPHFLA